MASYFCPYCETQWPYDAHYKLCPQCREPTKNIFAGERCVPLHPEEAVVLTHRAEFGWWLWETGRL